MYTVKKEIWDSLTEEQKQILQMIKYERVTRQELAKRLGISDGFLRLTIGDIKNKGIYIHSSSNTIGYKLADTKEEMKEIDDYEYHMAMVYLKRRSKRGKLN